MTHVPGPFTHRVVYLTHDAMPSTSPSATAPIPLMTSSPSPPNRGASNHSRDQAVNWNALN